MNCPDCGIPDPEHQMRCRLRGNLLYPILTDLIEELRRTPRVVLSSYMGHISRTALDSQMLDAALVRAEARLRGGER